MGPSLLDLQSEAAATGFRPEILDKAIHLLQLLDAFQKNPYLKERIALKGGTALNLFVYDSIPRLSIDVDLNYIGSAERSVMLRERKDIEQFIKEIIVKEGFVLGRLPKQHAGGKMHMKYTSAMGRNANLQVDLIYTLRVPLWPVQMRNSCTLGSFQARDIPVLDIHELAAGKLCALFSRMAGRDLFDAHNLLKLTELDQERLRLAFVVYGAFNRKDWRTVSPDDIPYDQKEILDQLIPVLPANVVPDSGNTKDWIKHMVADCRDGLSSVLPFEQHELDFLNLVIERGIITPELLTKDSDLAERISQHPHLRWKAQHAQGKEVQLSTENQETIVQYQP